MRIPAAIVSLVLLFPSAAPSQVLFETDYGAGIINIFPPGGAPSPLTTGLAPTGFTGLAFDTNGNLFVGDSRSGRYNEGRILRFTADGSSRVFASGLWGPFSLAFNKDGVLFTSDYNNNIYEYTPQGERTIFASGLSDPVGLAFDANGNLFVSEWDSGDIHIFTPDGVQSTFASGFNRPAGLAFDSAGNLFVVENGYYWPSGSVYKITPGGITTTIVSGLFGPTGLAFDSQENLYVTDTWNGQIFKLSPDGSEALFASGLNLPTYLAFQPIVPLPPPTIICPGALMLDCENGRAVGTVQVSVQETNYLLPLQVIFTVDDVPYQTNNIPAGGAVASTNLTLTAIFGPGDHLVRVSASNGQAPATCSTTVSVRDTIAPSILGISAVPNVLWPPNKGMIPVHLTVDAVDNCDPTIATEIIKVTSSEPQKLSTPDWQITGGLTLNLRADRAGVGQGRVYTIQVRCEDSSGNASYASVTVAVPHDRR